MAYLLAILALVATTFAQPLSPRMLYEQPSTRQIDYMAMKVNNFGQEAPVDMECGKYVQPDARDTPNPLMQGESRVTVDIVVGWDGKVYSPFVLATDSAKNDRVVLNALRSWRFKPALCNGIPINTEAHIEFSQR